jgi:3-hydroxy-D-aspartate aldolase
MRYGAPGVCCQKVSEAEALIDGGVPDVLVTNEVVGDRKLVRLARMAKRARVAVCVDRYENIAELAAAMKKEGASLAVLVEINVGNDRCGVEPGEAAVQLAQAITRHAGAGLCFGGLQAYYGSAQHIRGVAQRRAAIDECVSKVRHTRQLLERAGLPCPKVTGGGTGSYLFEADSGVYDELQAGSYIFMDGHYHRNEWEGSGIPCFEQSLFVWTTVLSANFDGRAVVDAGLKACSTDAGMPTVAGRPEVTYVRASDEHGVLSYSGPKRFRVGEKLKLEPGHCDPTVNLHDWYVMVRGHRVEALWPVDARGAVF